MALPVACQEPKTALQKALVDMGYTRWWLFPASDFPQRRGFYSALAAGLLCHTWPRYEEYLTLQTTGTWHQLMSPLKSIDSEFNTQHGEHKFRHPLYWKSLSNEVKTQCQSIFEEKIDVSQLIQSFLIKDTSDQAFYEKIARHFYVYLIIYEMTEDGLRDKVFHSDRQGEFAVFVNIAFEGDSVLLLNHRDFEWETLKEQKFPNYKKIKWEGGEPPRVSDPPRRESSFKWPVIVSNLVEISNLVARFALNSDTNPETGREIQGKIKERLDVMKEMGKGREDLNLTFGEVERLLELQIPENKPLPKPREPHTIQNCEDYPEIGPLQLHHHHQFHIHCLHTYLKSLAGDFSSGLKCPIETCGTPLPDSVLDDFPDVQLLYTNRKKHTMIMHSMTVIDESIQPCQCCEYRDVGVVLSCGCRVCRKCSSNSYYAKNCVRCGKATNAQDEDMIMLVFQKHPTAPN